MTTPIRSIPIVVLAFCQLTSMAASAEPLIRCNYTIERKEGSLFNGVWGPAPQQGDKQSRSFEEFKQAYTSGKWNGKLTAEACTTLDDTDASWHLFVQTRNGTVSLQHGMTENTCWVILRKLRSPECSNCTYVSDGSEFKQGECFK